MVLEDDIQIRVVGKTGRITLTRPRALNALTYEMCLAIEAALDEWASGDEVELVVIDAQGDRAFCAGGDVAQLYETGKAGDYSHGRKFWADEYRLNAKLANYPIAYVAIMDGITMGGGVGISAHGSDRIVTERTRIAMPECAIGLVPDVGGSFILSRAPGFLGEYLAMTGYRMGPGDGIFAGFADAQMESSKKADLITRLENTADLSVLGGFAGPGDAPALASHLDKINRHFGGKSAIEVVHSLEDEETPWAEETAGLIRRSCPLSVACAFEMIRQVRNVSTIEEALTIEYRFTSRSVSHGEFIEGVRAQIVDKDRNPNWQTARLEDVTKGQIRTMLAPLGDEELQLMPWKKT
jgi:enoyl-CoA hydratase/carnithine racemase